jgi:pyocin large subunit-like protein
MPTRQTRGFRSILHRSDHFTAHGKRLGIATEEEYEEFADRFLGTPCPATARQFTRVWNGDLVRYDEVSDVFGVLGADRFIRTCYRPDPRYHGEASNLQYYLSEEAGI